MIISLLSSITDTFCMNEFGSCLQIKLYWRRRLTGSWEKAAVGVLGRRKGHGG
jgi:hypothetical protein